MVEGLYSRIGALVHFQFPNTPTPPHPNLLQPSQPFSPHFHRSPHTFCVIIHIPIPIIHHIPSLLLSSSPYPHINTLIISPKNSIQHSFLIQPQSYHFLIILFTLNPTIQQFQSTVNPKTPYPHIL